MIVWGLSGASEHKCSQPLEDHWHSWGFHLENKKAEARSLPHLLKVTSWLGAEMERWKQARQAFYAWEYSGVAEEIYYCWKKL